MTNTQTSEERVRSTTDMRGHTVVEAHMPCINGLNAWVVVADLGKPQPEDEMFGGIDRPALAHRIASALNTSPFCDMQAGGGTRCGSQCIVCQQADEMAASAAREEQIKRLRSALLTAEAILYAHGKPIDPAITAALKETEE